MKLLEIDQQQVDFIKDIIKQLQCCQDKVNKPQFMNSQNIFIISQELESIFEEIVQFIKKQTQNTQFDPIYSSKIAYILSFFKFIYDINFQQNQIKQIDQSSSILYNMQQMNKIEFKIKIISFKADIVKSNLFMIIQQIENDNLKSQQEQLVQQSKQLNKICKNYSLTFYNKASQHIFPEIVSKRSFKPQFEIFLDQFQLYEQIMFLDINEFKFFYGKMYNEYNITKYFKMKNISIQIQINKYRQTVTSKKSNLKKYPQRQYKQKQFEILKLPTQKSLLQPKENTMIFKMNQLLSCNKSEKSQSLHQLKESNSIIINQINCNKNHIRQKNDSICQIIRQNRILIQDYQDQQSNQKQQNVINDQIQQILKLENKSSIDKNKCINLVYNPNNNYKKFTTFNITKNSDIKSINKPNQTKNKFPFNNINK